MFTREKTITVFDNGGDQGFKRLSRVVEMGVKSNTNKILWEYDGTIKKDRLSRIYRWQMFSPWISGVQKTKKGYLMTRGMQGRILKVSKDHKL